MRRQPGSAGVPPASGGCRSGCGRDVRAPRTFSGSPRDHLYVCNSGPKLAFEELRDHFSVHVGQAEVAALVFECEFGVIDPEAMQKSGMKIMNMHRIFGYVV